MVVEVQFLSPDSTRAELIAALLVVNKEARRTLAFDSCSRPNPFWAEQHEFMNTLLDLLEDEKPTRHGEIR